MFDHAAILPGGRRADGWTLPSALDIAYNPYDRKRKCHGLSDAATVGWITSFGDEVRRRMGRRPVIRTTTRWWGTCTGDGATFDWKHAAGLADLPVPPPFEGRTAALCGPGRPAAGKRSGDTSFITPARLPQFIFRSPRLPTVHMPLTSERSSGKWKTSR
ncbi:hypothetical protein ACKI19_14790 [Streptomyces caniscabiei]|uniref:hypothetical protein n=1 Tax=Streptomyces caniscabiei TaxID=2746961 RepID=UPI0038F725B7